MIRTGDGRASLARKTFTDLVDSTENNRHTPNSQCDCADAGGSTNHSHLPVRDFASTGSCPTERAKQHGELPRISAMSPGERHQAEHQPD
jgi:hypothetical protein